MKGKEKLSTQSLTGWFKKWRRDLPWREETTPYRVWVSEVMLQQTRAETVIPYFEEWLTLFPSIEALAKASAESVIKAWEGLGYYSRARALHKAAIFLIQNHDGQLPKTLEGLLAIPGIGPYTAGAILSFAYKKRALAIDGNVTRVIARLFAIEQSVDSSGGKKAIIEALDSFLPQENSPMAMEALIELGALICQKKPKCRECPLVQQCLSYNEGKEGLLPIKKKRPPIERKERTVLILLQNKKLLLQKGSLGKVMEGLYEFPYFEGMMEPKEALKLLGFEKGTIQTLEEEQHSFTRFQVNLHPFFVELPEKSIKTIPQNYEWVEAKNLSTLPFSSGHRRILHKIMEFSILKEAIGSAIQEKLLR